MMVDEIEFADNKNASQNEGGYQPSYQQAPIDRPDPASAAEDGFMQIPEGIDESLPFN